MIPTFRRVATACALLQAVLAQETFLSPGWVGVNNGPGPYRSGLGTGNPVVGGVDPSFLEQANTTFIATQYTAMGIQSIRPNDQGGVFSLECLFPISNIDQIPNPDSVSEHPSWNFERSDAAFSDMISNGFAPLLKLASREWKSTKWNGMAYQDFAGNVTYVIPPAQATGYCEPWPAVAPILMAIGPELALTIVRRYNNATLWANALAAGGLPQGPPLEPETWRNASKSGFVGVELQNEYNWLECIQVGNETNRTTLAEWESNCAGRPYTWSTRYWDGSPEQAVESYISQAKAIKESFPNVLVGGPALGTSSSFGLQPSSTGAYPAGGAGRLWVRGFLTAIASSNAPLDFFSWHAYASCKSPFGDAYDCGKDNPTSLLGVASMVRGLLDESGFNSTPTVVSEFNAAFGLNPGNAAPGTLEGASFIAVSLFKFAKSSLNVSAGWIVNGLDGPYLPHNDLSFPLDCTPEFNTTTSAGDKPEDLVFSGWANECVFGPGAGASINSDSGMGILFNNGQMKPTAAMLTEISPLLGKELLATGSLLEDSTTAEIIALRDDTRTYILLANGESSPVSVDGLQDFVSNLTNLTVARILDLDQHLRNVGNATLPDDISEAGTVQAQGVWSERSSGAISNSFQLDGYGIVILELLESSQQPTSSSLSTSCVLWAFMVLFTSNVLMHYS